MRAGKTICLISPKGGSGKTITCSALSKVFAYFGVQTLLVDGDAATNGLTLLNIEEIRKAKEAGTDKHVGIFDAADSSDQIDVTIIQFEDGNAFLPATYSMIHTEDVEVEAYRKTLVAVKERYSNSFPAIMIDAQAGSDQFTREAVDVADIVIIVSEYDPVSTDGVDRLKVHFNDLFARKEVWTLFNKVLVDFVPSLRQRSEVESTLPPIAWDAEVVKAFARRRTALDFENLNPYTLAIVQIAQYISGEEINERINEWKTQRVDVAKQPVRDKFERIDKEINKLERDKVIMKLGVAAVLSLLVAVGFAFIGLVLFRGFSVAFYEGPGIYMFALAAGLTAFIIGAIATIMRYGAAKRDSRIRDLLRLREQYSALVSSRDVAELQQLTELWGFLEDQRK